MMLVPCSSSTKRTLELIQGPRRGACPPLLLTAALSLELISEDLGLSSHLELPYLGGNSNLLRFGGTPLPPAPPRLLSRSGALKSQGPIVEEIRLPSPAASESPFVFPINEFTLFMAQPWKLITKHFYLVLTQNAYSHTTSFSPRRRSMTMFSAPLPQVGVPGLSLGDTEAVGKADAVAS